MPLYTFTCKNDHEKEVLCKYDEREDILEVCDCGEPMRWQGVERVQKREFQKGRFAMRAIMPDGNKLPINNINSPKKRSDS